MSIFGLLTSCDPFVSKYTWRLCRSPPFQYTERGNFCTFFNAVFRPYLWDQSGNKNCDRWVITQMHIFAPSAAFFSKCSFEILMGLVECFLMLFSCQCSIQTVLKRAAGITTQRVATEIFLRSLFLPLISSCLRWPYDNVHIKINLGCSFC